MNKYQKSDIITMNDVTFDGKTGIAEVMSVFQDAVTVHTYHLGVNAPKVRDKLNAKWVITRIRFEINSRLSFGDKYTVTTWPIPAKPLRFGRSFILDRDGERAVSAYTDWCLLDIDTNEVVRSNRLDMNIDEYLTDTAISGKFSLAREKYDDSDIVYSRTMRLSDIDLNRHVNNISYIRMALDCFSTQELESMDIKSFEMYYISQCYEGDTLTLYRNGSCIEARCDGNTIFRCTVNL